MKKIINLIETLIISIILLFGLVACSSSPVGEYKWETYKYGEYTFVAGEEYQGITLSESAITLKINKDNTYEVSINLLGTNENVLGTWEINGTELTLKSNGKDSKAIYQNNYITLSDTLESTQILITFKK